MPRVTTKQRKLAEVIVENATLDKPLNAGEMVAKVGYSAAAAKHKPGQIIGAEGVQTALADIGFDPDTAKKVVATILAAGENDAVKLKAADMVFKVHGTYAAEKSVALNVNVDAQIPSNEAENLR